MLKELKLFKFTAQDTTDKHITGYLFAPTEADAYSFLVSNKLRPASLKKNSHLWFFLKSCFFCFSSVYHITPKMKVFFYRYLGGLLQSNFPPGEACLYLLKNTKCIPLKKFAYILWVKLNRGYKLSQALSELPESFISKSDLALIAASENLRHLDQVFLSIANEKEENIKARLSVASSIYFLLALNIVLIFISHKVALKVIPYLIEDGRLNNYNLTIVMNAYNFIFGLKFMALLKMLLIGAAVVYICSKFLNQTYMRFLPYFREIIRTRELYGFFCTFTIGIKNHLSLQETFLISAQTLNNPYFRKNTLKIYEKIIRGIKFEDALTHSNFLSLEEQQLLALSIASKQTEASATSIRNYAKMKMMIYTQLNTNLIRIILIAILLSIVALNLILTLEVYFITEN